MKATLVVSILAILAACTDAPEHAAHEAELEAEAAPPKSTIRVNVDDGNPTSQHPYPPSVEMVCNLPGNVLRDFPIHEGGPVWTHCEVVAVMRGQPPTSIGYELWCGDSGVRPSTGHEMRCSVDAGLLPPRLTGGGVITYPPDPPRRPGRTDYPVDLDTCLEYIARALGVCQRTGEIVE